MGRKHYDKAFKENAVKLSKQRKNQAELAKELGISRTILLKWRKEFDEFGSASFPGRGNERLTEEGRKVKELEKALKERELELEILKKAIAIFSKTDG
ncbi:MAG: transposase [Rikenellaceae bacterium]